MPPERSHRLSTGVLALTAALVVWSPTIAGAAAPLATNRLIDSSDPYLRMHAHNPVDWYPWGPEAFAKAKAEGKPIFLSIGYSTCYWCHVAERTIYSDPAIAALMNKWFVNIKVDREQRPDVDRLYIIATEMLTQHGAWPNNLFLTPDGRPFYAGSYFPPKDEPGGTMGFPTVLAAIHDLWQNHRADKVEPAARELAEALKRVAAAQSGARPVPVTPQAWLKQATAASLKSVDPVNGGFGNPRGGQKFPQAPALDLLLAAAALDHDAAAQAALTKALEAMAYGGIHDHLGGGFHRYSTDPSWTVPHFEKMLSDNAQLLALYAGTYRPTQTPLLRDVAADIATYLMRDMQAPDGGFYTAQDAETRGVEGADYLWTRAEIETELGARDAARFLAVYEIAPVPDASLGEDGKAPAGGVLRVRLPIAETVRRVGATDLVSMLNAVAPLRADLLEARRNRPQPATDEKIVTGLNGLAIGALARAGAELGRPDMIDAASKAADRIWALADDHRTGLLSHEIIDGKAEVDGYVEDYAMLGDGFLTLADVTKENAWRLRAAKLADAMLARFAQPDGRLADRGDGLLVSLGDDSDGDTPAGTSAALRLLTRLGAATDSTRSDGDKEASGPDRARFETAAARLATAMSGQIARHPTAWPSAIAAMVRRPIAPRALAAAEKPEQTAKPEPQAASPAAAADATTPGVPTTADHVHASARRDGDRIAVKVEVDPGYHINAHEPSLDYLVPTELAFAGLKPSSVAYPQTQQFKPSFAKDALSVYEGSVSLVARFPPGALSGVVGLAGTLAAQACDAKTCLPPTTIPFVVGDGG